MMFFSLSACDDGKMEESTQNNGITEVSDINTQPETEKEETNTYNNSSVLFLTEYDVEDYVENTIIVSKNDQLLFGLLDGNGNTIIPIKYDKMNFMNKEDYINGYSEPLIWAKYEDTEYVFDTEGNIIIESKNNLGYINYAIKTNFTDEVAVISETTEDYISLYNSDAKKMHSIKNYQSVKYISDKACLIIDCSVTYNGETYTSDIDGVAILNLIDNTLNKFGFVDIVHVISGTNVCYAALDSKVLSINEDGAVIEEKDCASYMEAYTFAQERQKSTIPYNLYESNSTWKMEDLNGNPLYAERYYSRYNFYEGENDCIFLMDENNSLCAFGKQGNLYAEFGKINVSGNDFYILTEEGEKRISKIHEGKESMVVITKSSSNSTIHIFEKINL